MFLNAIAWLIGTFVLGMLLNYIFYKFAGFLFRPIGSFLYGFGFWAIIDFGWPVSPGASQG